MAKVTAEYVRHALEAQHVWDLGNAVLYKLCADHPYHTIENVIIAKIWLIGSSYAIALERRRGKGDFLGDGDAFYVEHVAPKISQANVDAWFPTSEGRRRTAKTAVLRVHNNMTKLLYDIAVNINVPSLKISAFLFS
jgi:hypothetical protein